MTAYAWCVALFVAASFVGAFGFPALLIYWDWRKRKSARP